MTDRLDITATGDNRAAAVADADRQAAAYFGETPHERLAVVGQVSDEVRTLTERLRVRFTVEVIYVASEDA